MVASSHHATEPRPPRSEHVRKFFNILLGVWLRTQPLVSISFVALRVMYPIGITKTVLVEDLARWWVKMGTLYILSSQGDKVGVSLMLFDADAKQELVSALEAMDVPFGEPD